MVGNGRVLAAGTGVDREGPGQVREDAAGEEAADSPQASLPRALLQLPGQHQGTPPAGTEPGARATQGPGGAAALELQGAQEDAGPVSVRRLLGRVWVASTHLVNRGSSFLPGMIMGQSCASRS